MSKVTRREWYERVNALWPADVSAPTALEAVRAARRLWRFATGETFPAANVRVTSGRRFTWVRRGVMSVNPDRDGHRHRGWQALVHDLSHYLHYRINPGVAPHSGAHARLEMRLIKEVLRRGWLQGALRDKPKAEKPKPDEKALKYARTLAAIERWEAKRRRAENALKKLNRSLRAQERAMAKRGVSATSTTVH